MSPKVLLPEGGSIDFPAGTSKDVIKRVTREKLGQDRPSANLLEDAVSGLNRGLEDTLGLPATLVENLFRTGQAAPQAAPIPGVESPFDRPVGVPTFPRLDLPTTAPTSAAGEFVQRTARSAGAALPVIGGGIALQAQKFASGLASLTPNALATLETGLATAGGAAAALFQQFFGKDSPVYEASVELLGALGVSGVAGLIRRVVSAKAIKTAIPSLAPEAELGVQRGVGQALPPESVGRANVKESVGLSRELGLTSEADFSLAQRSGSPTIARTESEFAGMSPGASARVVAQQLGARRQLVGQVEETLGAGTLEGPEAAQAALRNRSEQLEASFQRRIARVEQAKTDARTTVGEGVSAEETGTRLQNLVEEERLAFREDAGELFSVIDDDILVTQVSTRGTAKAIVRRAKKLGDPEVPPIIRRLAGPEPKEVPAGFRGPKAEAPKVRGPKKQTFGFMRTQRSLLLQEIRRELAHAAPSARKLEKLNRMVDAVEADLDSMLTAGGAPAEAVQAYRDAAAFYRPRAQLFKRGRVQGVLRRDAGGVFRVPNKDVPGKFLSTDQDVADFMGAISARSSIEVPGGVSADVAERLVASRAAGVTSRQSAVNTMREFLIGDFVNKVIDDSGRVLGSKVKQFMKAHEAGLRAPEFADLRRRFQNLESAQKLVDSRVAFHEQVRSVRDAHAATLYLKADPNVAIKQILALPNKAEATRQLVALMRRDPAALRGLRRAFADETILSTIGPGESAADVFRNAKGFLTWIERNSEVIGALYSPEHLAHLRQIGRGFELLERSPAVAGASVTGQGTPMFTTSMIASRMFALARGVVGKAFLAAEGALRRVDRLMGEHNAKALEAIVEEVLYDPEFAKTIALSGSMRPSLLSVRIRAHIVNTGRLLLEGEQPELEERPQQQEQQRPSAVPALTR